MRLWPCVGPGIRDSLVGQTTQGVVLLPGGVRPSEPSHGPGCQWRGKSRLTWSGQPREGGRYPEWVPVNGPAGGAAIPGTFPLFLANLLNQSFQKSSRVNPFTLAIASMFIVFSLCVVCYAGGVNSNGGKALFTCRSHKRPVCICESQE